MRLERLQDLLGPRTFEALHPVRAFICFFASCISCAHATSKPSNNRVYNNDNNNTNNNDDANDKTNNGELAILDWERFYLGTDPKRYDNDHYDDDNVFY